jgi:hypothetical protein
LVAKRYQYINNPVELELADRLRGSTIAHVAESTSGAYVGPWNTFVLWCETLMRPRRPFPINDITIAIYIQSLMDKAIYIFTITYIFLLLIALPPLLRFFK